MKPYEQILWSLQQNWANRWTESGLHLSPAGSYCVATPTPHYCHFYDFIADALLQSVENNYGYSIVRWSNRWRGLTAWQCQTQVCHECLSTRNPGAWQQRGNPLLSSELWSAAWRQDRSFPTLARKVPLCLSLPLLWNTKGWWVSLKQQLNWRKGSFALGAAKECKGLLPPTRTLKMFSVCGPWLLQQGIPQVHGEFPSSCID